MMEVRTQARKILLFSSALFCLTGFPAAERRPASEPDLLKQYYSLSQRSRLLSQDWNKILGSRRGGNYKVRRHDNLWKICRKLFNDGFLWRKLWHVNPEISNPHQIEIGQNLTYDEKNLRGLASDNVVRVPLLRLHPDNGSSNIDTDSVATVKLDIKNRLMPYFFELPESETDPIWGEIVGSYGESRSLDYHHAVYVELADDVEASPGQKFSVVRPYKELNEYASKKVEDTDQIVKLIGEVVLIEKEEKYWLANVVNVYGDVSRGDFLVPLITPVEWSLYLETPKELQAFVLGGEGEGKTAFMAGDIVMLDKGRQHGMKEGYVFQVWDENDPFLERDDKVEPSPKGEVRVVSAFDYTSIGYIIKNSSPIHVRDAIVPKGTLLNPYVKPVAEPLKSIEIK